MPSEQGDLTRDPLIRAFGAVLRCHRDGQQMSPAQLAEALGCTRQWIDKLEAAKSPPSEATADDLDTYFETPRRMFHEMWKEIKNAGKHVAAPPGFRRYAALEQQASTIHTFESLLISGLLQTEDYARAVMASLQAPETIDQAIAVRMKRKAILEGNNPTRVWLTLDEWVLRRKIGGPDVLRDQLRYLLEVGSHPNIMIQILPHDTDHYVALSGSFTLLGFDDAPDVAYIEAAGQGNLIQDGRAVADCAVRYDLLRGHAHPVAESRTVIETAMEQL